MKTSRFSLLILPTAICLLLFVNSCACEDSRCDDCEPPASQIPTQVVIQFERDKSIQLIEKTIDNLNEEADTVYRCMCGQNLIMAEYPYDPAISLNDRLASAKGDIEQEDGQPIGTVHANIRIQRFEPELTLSNKDTVVRENDPTSKGLVAIIDGGISKSMEHGLRNYIWVNPNETNNNEDDDGNCLEDDINGFDFTLTDANTDINVHGTIVSKLIADHVGSTDMKLMDLRIFDQHGKTSLFQAACATLYAVFKGAHVINMSWGYYAERAPQLHLDNIAETGRTTVIASAGNDCVDTDICPHFPSGFNATTANVIGVAAMNRTYDDLAKYSNYGVNTIQLAAPGVHNVFGLDLEATSYAAPMITAKAVEYLLDHPGAPNTAVIQCIKDSTVPIPSVTIPVISNGAIDMNSPCSAP